MLFTQQYRDFPSFQPHEDLGEASAMKILYLLFPFFLLLIQGAAETGNEAQCRQRGGFCTIGRCHYPTTAIGRCSSYRHCCRSI
nr:gallinacin-3-like isoform X3 [Columba livia]